MKCHNGSSCKWRDMGSENTWASLGLFHPTSPGVKEWNITPVKNWWLWAFCFFGASWQIGECPPSIIQLCKLEWVDEFLTNTNWSWLKVLVVSSRSNRDVCRKMTCKTNPRDLAASIAAYLFFCEWHTPQWRCLEEAKMAENISKSAQFGWCIDGFVGELIMIKVAELNTLGHDDHESPKFN